MKTVTSTLLALLTFALISIPAQAQTVTPPPANPSMYLPLVSQPQVPTAVTGTAVLPSPTSTLPPDQTSTTVYIPMM